MVETDVLWKHAFDDFFKEGELTGRQIRDLDFSSGDHDEVNLTLEDWTRFSFRYQPQSLMQMRAIQNCDILRRFIPPGKPTHDDYFSGVLSAGQDAAAKGKEFDIQEPLTPYALRAFCTKHCDISANSSLGYLYPYFGLQNWLNIRIRTQDNVPMCIDFKFERNSSISASFSGDRGDILYLPRTG